MVLRCNLIIKSKDLLKIMSSTGVSKPIMIDLNIGDQLTSISCGHVVVELVKFIAYQRQQIPYTYQWLKQAVVKRKMCEEHADVKESFQSERHFRTASAALENLDFILKSLLQEMNGSSIPDEVCIALGGSPVMCKEVYRLILPRVCHKPQCHSSKIASDQKLQRDVFKSLVTAEKLSQVFFKPLPPTNMFVFLKKKTLSGQDTVISCDNFQQTSGCRIPRNSKIIVIDFRTQNHNSVMCCDGIQIYGDANPNIVTEITQRSQEEVYHEIESTDTATWYQSSYVMRGFKDSIVNGSSITNEWLKS